MIVLTGGMAGNAGGGGEHALDDVRVCDLGEEAVELCSRARVSAELPGRPRREARLPGCHWKSGDTSCDASSSPCSVSMGATVLDEEGSIIVPNSRDKDKESIACAL